MSPDSSRAHPPEPGSAVTHAAAKEILQREVARLAASPEIRSAFNWFRANEPQLLQ